MAAQRAPLSLGFSRQEHWSGLPFPSPMRESEVAQSCPTLSDPMDCSLPGSSVHGIFQARVLEWVAIAFSNLTCINSLNFLNDLMKQIYYYYDCHPILQTKKWRHREFKSQFDILKQKISDKETES